MSYTGWIVCGARLHGWNHDADAVYTIVLLRVVDVALYFVGVVSACACRSYWAAFLLLCGLGTRLGVLMQR